MNWLLISWIVTTVIGTAAAIAAFIWGLRRGQFGDQQRARRLPLDSGIPSDDEWGRRK